MEVGNGLNVIGDTFRSRLPGTGGPPGPPPSDFDQMRPFDRPPARRTPGEPAGIELTSYEVSHIQARPGKRPYRNEWEFDALLDSHSYMINRNKEKERRAARKTSKIPRRV